MTVPSSPKGWPWYSLVFVGASAAALLIAWLVAPTVESSIRTTGGLLQGLGLGAVAVGMAQVRRSFGLPSTMLEMWDHWRGALSSAWDWILRAVGRGRPRDVVMGAGTGRLTMKVGRARVRVRPGPDNSIEQKVDLLYRLIDSLENGLDRLEEGLDKETAEREKALAAERQAWETDLQALSVQLKDFAVGGLRLQAVGLWWLLFGVALATWSPEISRALAPATYDSAASM